MHTHISFIQTRISRLLNDTIYKRLLPLYIAIFLQGFVLWYAIEKLFMQQIGFDEAGIGMMAALFSGIMLLVETPSGILADRWSRKGVLVLAGIMLAISSVVCGMSNDILMYFVGAGLWGMFFALYSGAYDSIIYDTLLEEGKDTARYEHYYGRLQVAHSLALVMGALIGAVVAEEFGIRNTYFWTVPIAIMSVVALLFLKEPILHKQQDPEPLLLHVRNTFGAILQKGRLAFILAAIVITSTISYSVQEFAQLWWIALVLPIVVFGPAFALILGTIGLGGWAATRFNLHRKRAMYTSIIVMTLSALGLVVLRNTWLVIMCQIILCASAIGVGVVFNRFLHDSLGSQIRAGAASAVSTVTRIIIIPFSLLFGFLSKEGDVFAASWMFVILGALCLIVVYWMFLGQQSGARSSSE